MLRHCLLAVVVVKPNSAFYPVWRYRLVWFFPINIDSVSVCNSLTSTCHNWSRLKRDRLPRRLLRTSCNKCVHTFNISPWKRSSLVLCVYRETRQWHIYSWPATTLALSAQSTSRRIYSWWTTTLALSAQSTSRQFLHSTSISPTWYLITVITG